MMTNGPEGRIFYHILILIMDSFSCWPLNTAFLYLKNPVDSVSQFHYKYGCIVWMKNNLDPDKSADLNLDQE